MTKKTEETQETGLNTKAETGLSTEMMDMFQADAGQGFEGVTMRDVAIPFLAILQSNSPQVKKGPTRIEGAEEGDVLHTVRQIVIKTDKEPTHVINCGFQKRWVEWVDRDNGGGFVSSHKTDEITRKCTRNEKGKLVLANGHNIVETAYHFVIVIYSDGSFEQAVISMASTQLKKSRRLMSQLMALKLNINGQKVDAPMFSHTFRVKTVMEQKDTNSWFGWDFSEPTLISNLELYKAAKKFHEVVKDGLDITPPAQEEEVGASNTNEY